MGQNATKIKLCANPLVQPYTFQKEARVTTDASAKAICGVLSQKGNRYICIEKIDSTRAKLLEHRAVSTDNCVHKTEAILSWKTIYLTEGPQTTQISLHQMKRSQRQHQLNHKTVKSSDGLQI